MGILTFVPIWNTFLCGLVSKTGLMRNGYFIVKHLHVDLWCHYIKHLCINIYYIYIHGKNICRSLYDGILLNIMKDWSPYYYMYAWL